MRILLLSFFLMLPLSTSYAEETQKQGDLDQFKEWSEVFTSLIELAQTVEQQDTEKNHSKTKTDDHNLSDQIMTEILDSENGTIKQLFNFIMNMVNEERAKKEQQANTLNAKIKFIISNVQDLGVLNAKIQLATIKWQPIGSIKIDSEMSTYYEELTASIIDQLSDTD
jgi:hypothetical protein